MRDRLAPLTSLRFFAALVVLLHHFVPLFAPDRDFGLLGRVAADGFAGVTLFFVLSGFVLAYNYADSLAIPTRQRIRDFYVARFARVYPLFLLTFLAVLPLSLLYAPGKALARAAAYQLTLTQSFVPNQDVYFSFNAPAWSVSAEAFFYLVFPAIAALLAAAGIRTPRRALLASAGLFGVWLWVGFHFASHPRFHWYCYVWPVHRLFDFAIGACCGIAYLRGSERGWFYWSFRAATALELGSLAALGGLAAVAGDVPLGVRLGPYYTPAAALLILTLAADRGAVSRLLRWGPWRVLGECSYAMYLVHIPLVHFFNVAKAEMGITDPPMGRWGLILAGATLSLSLLLHFGFERPARSLLRTWLGSRQTPIAKPELPAHVERVVETILRRAA